MSSAIAAAVEQARADERAAIVAWLLKNENGLLENDWIADAIQHGAHHTPPIGGHHGEA